MSGVMAPPKRYPARPLMRAAATPLRAPRGLMYTDPEAFADFDLQAELRHFLWAIAGLLAILLYVAHAAR